MYPARERRRRRLGHRADREDWLSCATLGNMRANGVWALLVYCTAFPRTAAVNTR